MKTLGKITAGFILGFGIVGTSKILNGPYAFFDSTWPALAGICVMTYLLIDLHASMHADQIQHGEYIVHWKANILRTVVLIALISLIHAYHFDFKKELWLFGYSCCWFGIVFNFRLNKRRKKPRFYMGEIDHRDSFSEIFSLFKYGGQVAFALEVIGMGVCGWYYLK